MRKIHKHLNQYGLALELEITFDEFMVELEMSQEEYITAVRTSLVRPKLVLKHRPCEIRINNYMKHCLEFLRAYHDIQPSLSPYAMVQYMLSYVTKTQKGMSAIMDRTCREVRQGNMDIKASVRHMGNAFLNCVETSAQEATCLVLQLPITRMIRKVVFIPTSRPDERTLLLKDFKTLQEMDPEWEDIQSHNTLVEYRKRPRCLEKYCLADFASELQIEYPKDVTFDDSVDDEPIDLDVINTTNEFLIEFPNGIVIKKQNSLQILRYVNYNIKRDPENHYRERLMLFLPWRNEESLYGSFVTYHFKAKKTFMTPVRKKYEQYNDMLEEAIEEVEQEELEGANDSEGDDIKEKHSYIVGADDYGFFTQTGHSNIGSMTLDMIWV